MISLSHIHLQQLQLQQDMGLKEPSVNYQSVSSTCNTLDKPVTGLDDTYERSSVYKDGYVIEKHIRQGDFPHYIVEKCFIPEQACQVAGGMTMEYGLTFDKEYIGNVGTARFICEVKGIKPQLAKPHHTVCSIGYCSKENKWYGWSHRAIYGFTKGSEVKPGDCAYTPSTMDEFVRYTLANNFNSEFYRVDRVVILDKKLHVDYTVLPKDASNPRACALQSSQTFEYKGGKGQWEARTMEEAKEMATDFAESVSSVRKEKPVLKCLELNVIPNIESVSAAKKKASDYGWFRYKGTKAKQFENRYYEMELSPKEVYGMRKSRGKYFIADQDALGETEFKLEEKDAQLLLARSAQFRGRVNNVVNPGDLDMAQPSVKGKTTKVKNVDLSGVPQSLRKSLKISSTIYVGAWRNRQGTLPFTLIKGTKAQVLETYDALNKTDAALEYGTLAADYPLLQKFENKSVSSINISEAQAKKLIATISDKRVHRTKRQTGDLIGVWNNGTKEKPFTVVQGTRAQVIRSYKKFNKNPESRLFIAEVDVDYPLLRKFEREDTDRIEITSSQTNALRRVMKNRKAYNPKK